MLIVPAGRERTVEKAFTTDADILMFDLDDGVVYEEVAKREARERVLQAISGKSDAPHDLVVRTNALDTPWWEADLIAAAAAGAHAVVPAKVESAADIAAIDRVLLQASANQVRIWPMVETAAAVTHVEEIATASVRVQALCFGVGDYTVTTQGEFEDEISHLAYPLTQVLCSARAHGLSAIAPAVVWTDVQRFDLLQAQALFLRKLGYDGAMVVTPKHLHTVNEVFTPTREAVRWALQLEGAIEQAHAAGQSAVVVDGRLVEIVNLKRAQQTLAIARSLAIVEEAS